jgi:glucan 1,3-beta-glucosidase
MAVAAIALAPGILIGWAFENALLESFGLGGWLRSIAIVAVALAAPLLAAAAVASDISVASFAQVLARKPDRLRDPFRFALGVVLVVLGVLAVERALGLAFDPRYRDFGFAPLTAAVVPYLVLTLLRAPAGARGAAETAMAAVLALCAVYIAVNESLANWQALWCSAALFALAITLLRWRAAPG